MEVRTMQSNNFNTSISVRALFLVVFISLPVLLSAQAPTAGATNFSVTNQDGNRLRVNWTRGNGSSILVVASTSPTFNGSGVPANGTDYNANSAFGLGNQIGTNNFVMYEGTSTGVTLTGLLMSTTYYFRLYEFNGTGAATQYNTTDVLSGDGTTLSPPTVGSSAMVATPTGNSASLTWTRGNGDRSFVILQAGSSPNDPSDYSSYTPSTAFGWGSAIGSGYVVYFNSSNTVNVTELLPNTQYFYKVVESNGSITPVYGSTNALTGSFTTAGAPTSGSTNFFGSSIQGDRFSYTMSTGNGTRRLVVARQDQAVTWTPTDGVDYNHSTAFGSGDNLGDNTFVVNEMTGTSGSLTGLTPATTYHLAVFEYNGTATNTVYLKTPAHVLTSQITTLSPPSVSGGNFNFTNVSGHSATVTFTAGNGDRRIVLARAGAAVTDVPVNLVSYSQSSNFSYAPALGDSRIVYDGAGTTLNINSLQPNTTYHFAVYEYNGSSGPVYKQADPGIGSFTSQGKPTVAPSALTFSQIEGDRFTINYTTGNGFGRTVIVKEGAPVDVFPTDLTSYTASTTFGTATAHLGNGNYVIQNNTAINSTTATPLYGLTIGQTYHIAIVESNGTGTERIYSTSAEALLGNQTTLVAPTQQATDVAFSNITATTATISWQSGNGNARMVLLREGQAVSSLPVDLTSYSYSSNFAASPGLGTSRVVYNGTSNTVNVTSIPPGQYHVAIVEYNGSSRPVYRISDPLTGMVTIGDKPTVSASNLWVSNINGNSLSLNCTAGNGLSRMVIAKAGSAVDAWPVDFTAYTSSSTFGNGSDLGGGNFVVGQSNSTSFTVVSLQPNTTYHFAIIEFNGTGATALYQLSTVAAITNQATLSTPTLATSNFFANNIIGNSMQVTWTDGDGDGRLIVAKAGSEVDYVPTDLSNPSASGSFGYGSNFGGGNYAVYGGTGDYFTFQNLEPGTTYHLASFEYNGNGGGRVYLTNSIARTSFTTASRPSQAPTGLSVSSVNGDRLTLSFWAGNGTRRLVVVRKGGLVNAVPTDLTTYTGGVFGVGTQLGTGNYVTYIGNGTSMTLTGLEPDTEYGVAVFELDGSVGNERYMVSRYINQLVKTTEAPSIPTFSLLYNAVGSNSANLSWTTGDGQGRMVVLRPYQPVTFEPTVLNSHGTSSANFASTSNNLPDGHKHIVRTGTSVTITNLAPGTTYHVAIYEFNGSSQPVYSSEPLRGYFTTLPTSGLAIGGFDAITFCPSQQVDVPYFFTGVLNAGNQLSIEMSDINGSFASPTVIGVQSTTNTSGFITSLLPTSLMEGTGYRLRVRATDPAQISADNGANLQITTSVTPTFTIAGGQTSTCGDPIELVTSQPGYNVQWFRNGTLISGAVTSTYFATESGDYQVRIAGASGGCQLFSAGTTLTITQEPDFDFDFPVLYCEDESLDLEPLTSPAGGTFTGTGITNGVFDATAAGVGQFIVEYTYMDAVSSCTFIETTSVQVASLPAAPLTTDALGCNLTAVSLSASGAVGTDTYQWYTSETGNTAITGETTATFTTPELATTTTYYVAINNGTCESIRTPVTATISDPIAVPVAVHEQRCDEGIVTVGVTGSFDGNYRWYTVSTGGTAIAGEENGIYTTPTLTETTSYFVAVNDGTCESERTEVVATVNASPSRPDVTPSGITTFCDGENVTLAAPAGFSYDWSTGETTQEITVATEGDYTVVITDANNCSSELSDAIEITVYPLPAQPVINSNAGTPLCIGETVTLIATASAGYSWSTDETTQEIQVTTSDSYTVVVRDANGCHSIPSAPVTLIFTDCNNQPPVIASVPLATPIGSILTVDVTTMLSDPDNNLDVSTLSIISQPSSGASATLDANGILTLNYTGVPFSGTETVELEVCDLLSSCSQQQLLIEVVGDVVVYNAISPNNDGLNDFLRIQYVEIIEEARQNNLAICNRWGDTVFEISNYDNDERIFKGLSDSGKELPSGTYFYKLSFSSGKSPKTGYLMLKR